MTTKKLKLLAPAKKAWEETDEAERRTKYWYLLDPEYIEKTAIFNRGLHMNMAWRWACKDILGILANTEFLPKEDSTYDSTFDYGTPENVERMSTGGIRNVWVVVDVFARKLGFSKFDPNVIAEGRAAHTWLSTFVQKTKEEVEKERAAEKVIDKDKDYEEWLLSES